MGVNLEAARTTTLSDRCAKATLTAIMVAVAACGGGDGGARCGPGTVEVDGQCIPEGAASMTDGGNGGGKPGEVELPPEDTVCVRTPVTETEACQPPESTYRSVDGGNIEVRMSVPSTGLRQLRITVPDGAPLPYELTARQVYWDACYAEQTYECLGGEARVSCCSLDAHDYGADYTTSGRLVDASPTRVAGWVQLEIASYEGRQFCPVAGDERRVSCRDSSVGIRFNFRP